MSMMFFICPPTKRHTILKSPNEQLLNYNSSPMLFLEVCPLVEAALRIPGVQRTESRYAGREVLWCKREEMEWRGGEG
jgi:hypothetical protein